VLTGVGVDGDDGHLVHHHGFSLVEQTVALITRLSLGRQVEDDVVKLVTGVAGVVVATVGDKQV